MATTTSQRLTFAQKLQAELARRKAETGHPWGARTVARLIVDRQPTRDLEQTRRAVRRWLTGTVPTQANRDEVTDALGLERGALDPDAEEEDPVAVEQERAKRRAMAAFEQLELPDLLQVLAQVAAEGTRR